MSSFEALAARGATAWWRYPLAFILALGLAVAGFLLIGLPLALMHYLPPNLAELMLSPSDPKWFFGANGLTFGLILLGLVVATRLVHRKTFTDTTGVWSWRAFGRGASLWGLILLVLTGIGYALAPASFRWSAGPGTAELAAWALAALAVQTFAEEFLFRGYITQALLLALRRPLPAAVVSGILFGALHIPNGVPQAANALVLGVALSLIAVRTGSLAFGWGLHLVNNMFGAVVVVSGSDVFRGSPGLFTQTAPQLLWWDVALACAATVFLTLLVLRRPGFGGRAPIEAGSTG